MDDTRSVNKGPETPTLVLVTETWPPEINGVAMTLSRLTEGLRIHGWQVRIVRPRQKSDTRPHPDHMLVPGIPIPGYSGLRFGLPMLEKLKQAWRQQRPDVVHIATEGPLGWAALKAARALGLPVTTSFHTNFHRYCKHYRMSWLRGAVTRHLRLFHNQSDLTLVPNETLRDMLQQENYRNVAVLGRGVDAGLFSPERRSAELRASWGLKPDDLAVIYVGRLAAEKNLWLAAKAFEAIRARQPTARMIWVGSGPLYKKLLHRYPEHIFCGPRLDIDLARHYASADLFLFPSLTETFGNVVTEAMASGLAVVAYDYAAAELFIEPGISGLLVPLGEANQFVETARTASADLARVRAMGRAASMAVRSRDWMDICAQFNLYLRAQIAAQAGEAALAGAPA